MKSFLKKVGMKDKDAALIGKVVQVGQNNVKMETVLGEGGFACIYRARDVSTGHVFALKHLRLQGDAEAINEVQHEAKTMAKLRGHPNILRLRAVAFAGQKGAETDAFMLLDYCPTTLIALLQSCSYQLDDAVLYDVFGHVLQGVAHMHSQTPPFAHRDLKVENILRLPDGKWILCDFGSATTRAKVYDTPAEIANEEDKIRRMTTPAYRAPEMWDLLSRQRIDTKADIWALGVMLYVLAFGKLPFQGDAKLPILYGRYDMPLTRSTELRNLIKDMLTVDPSKRPDVFAVISRFDTIKRSQQGGLMSPTYPQPMPATPSSMPSTPNYSSPFESSFDPGLVSGRTALGPTSLQQHSSVPQPVPERSTSAQLRQQQLHSQQPSRNPPNPPTPSGSSGGAGAGGGEAPDWADFSNQPQVFQQQQGQGQQQAASRPSSSSQAAGSTAARIPTNSTIAATTTFDPSSVQYSRPQPPSTHGPRITSPPAVTPTSASGPQPPPAGSRQPSPNTEVADLQEAVLRLQSGTMGDLEAIRIQLKEVVVANKGMNERIKSLEEVVASQQSVIKRLRAALMETPEDTLVQARPSSPGSSRANSVSRPPAKGSTWETEPPLQPSGGGGNGVAAGRASPSRPTSASKEPFPNIIY